MTISYGLWVFKLPVSQRIFVVIIYCCLFSQLRW